MTAVSQKPGLSLPQASPDGWVAAILLAFLATAGLFYVNIMAAIVDGLVAGLGFTEAQAGQIGSINIYGAAAGALVSVFLIKAVPWRVLASVCLTLLIAIDIASIQIGTFELLLPVRAIHGFSGGILTGTAFALIARTAHPDRTFGMLLFVQFGLGGLGVMLLPPLAPLYGTQALFIALALFSLVTFIMVPFLTAHPARATSVVAEGSVR